MTTAFFRNLMIILPINLQGWSIFCDKADLIVEVLHLLLAQYFLDILKNKFGTHINGCGWATKVMNYHSEELISKLELILQFIYSFTGTNTNFLICRGNIQPLRRLRRQFPVHLLLLNNFFNRLLSEREIIQIIVLQNVLQTSRVQISLNNIQRIASSDKCRRASL